MRRRVLSLPRKALTLLLLAMRLAFALPAWAQQKPFTRDQVEGSVRDGLGDEFRQR